MKKHLFLLASVGILGINQMSSQNSFNAIKTSQRGGILTTLVNPAKIAGMPQKFDINIIGFDLQVANNVVNLTSSELGKTGDFKDRFLNNVTSEGLTMRINADIMLPSLAIALNKKTTVGLVTRGRINIAANNLDIALGKAIADGGYNPGTKLPYESPNINNMSGTVIGWAEIGGAIATEIYKDKSHSLKIGGTVKALFPGAYANTYMRDLKFFLDTVPGSGDPYLYNVKGSLGIEYNGSNDPLNDAGSNLIGGPKGIGFDAGITYQLKNPKTGKYILEVGASLLDVGSLKFNLNRSSSRQFVLNPGPHDPTKVQGDNLDEIINSIKANNIAREVNSDTNITVNLPMAYNFQADVHLWKPFYVTLNLQKSATTDYNPRNIQAANYLTITPRVVSKFVEVYVPFSFAEIQGNSIGAGLKVGPLYLGSNSIISAVATNNNKAVDFHFGIRAGFGKRFQ